MTNALTSALALRACALSPHAWGLIKAEGEDALSFLQGQLTQDVLSLQPGEIRLAGYCNAKGRLLASFWLWRGEQHSLYLACRADILAPTLKRAKVKLSDATASLPLWGVVQPSDAAPLQTPSHWLPLPDAPGFKRYLAFGTDPLSPASAQVQPLSLADWQALELYTGVGMIEQATVEQFVPQMLNYDLIQGVNFKKGCYPGQEIVARSQYLGKLKRRTFLLRSDPSEHSSPADAWADLRAGTEVFAAHEPEQPCGMIVNSLPQQGLWLAELKLETLRTAGFSLHLSSASGPLLSMASLPYAVPLDGAVDD
jgi:folate-binding protein YgfZ